MADETGERLRETAPGAMLEMPKAAMKRAGETMLKDAPKGVTRYVLRAIPWGPGVVYDAAKVLTAKDRARAGLGVAGGLVGGVLGEAAGPLGAAVGYSAGEAGAEWLYDHHDELARKAADTAQWMKARAAHLAGRAAHGFDRGMPPYSTPLR
jgi:hypothetical protein